MSKKQDQEWSDDFDTEERNYDYSKFKPAKVEDWEALEDEREAVAEFFM